MKRKWPDAITGRLSAVLNKSLDRQVLERTAQLRDALRDTNRANTILRKEIAEREWVETALRESDERFRMIAASAHSALIMMDEAGNVSFWNEAATRIFGHTRDEIIGKPWDAILAPTPSHDSFSKTFRKFTARSKGSAIGRDLELVGLRKDGAEFPMELSFSAVRTNGKWHSIGIARDVSNRKETERALRDAKEELATTLESIGDGVIAVDKDGKVTLINPVAEALTGWDAGSAIGAPFQEVFNAVDEQGRQTIDCPVTKVIRTGMPVRLAHNAVLVSRDGSERSIADSCSPIRDNNGSLTGVVLVFRDVTEKRKAKEALRRSEERYRTLIEHASEGIFCVDETGRFQSANSSSCAQCGYLLEELLEMSVFELVPPEDMDYALSMFQAALSGSSWVDEFKVIRKDGTTFDAEISAKRLPEGQLLGMVRDVTARKQAECQVRLHAAAMNAADDLIAILDREGRIVFANNAFQEQTGRTLAELIGRDLSVMVPSGDDALSPRHIWSAIKSGLAWSGELLCKQKGDSSYTADVTMTPLSGADGRTEHLVVIARNITERKVYEGLLDYQAHHDDLTGLPNRLLFSDELDSLVSDRRTNHKCCAILFIDLDKFKLVNDTMGHHVGDALLVEVAARLSSCLREGDTLARMGGDEFTVLLKNVRSPDEAGAVANRMLDLVSLPCEIGRSKLVIGASIGISIYPDNADDATGLLKNADAAMYRAKELGRNNCQFFSEELNQTNITRVETERNLRLAIKKGELVVFYQPIVDARTMQIVGAEALLRWDSPEKGFVSPGLFVPVAEETGLILDIGRMVLETACEQCKRWKDSGYDNFEMSVNVSALQLRKKGFVPEVLRVLSMTGLPPESLKLEITETLLAKNDYGEIDTLCRLEAHGVKACLDDFGIGYSSLSRLKNFPIIHMKVDGSFIKDIEHSPKDRAMTESIISLAHNLGIQVTAEWIENEEQLAAIRSLDCDYAQGYLISPALSANAFEQFLSNWRGYTIDKNAA